MRGRFDGLGLNFKPEEKYEGCGKSCCNYWFSCFCVFIESFSLEALLGRRQKVLYLFPYKKIILLNELRIMMCALCSCGDFHANGFEIELFRLQ